MSEHELAALLFGCLAGFWIYEHVGDLLPMLIWRLYFVMSERRFNMLYDITEGYYELLDDIFRFPSRVKHYQYIEAFRAFEDGARLKLRDRAYHELSLISKSLFRLAVLTLLGLMFFWYHGLYYVSGIVAGFVITVLFEVIMMRVRQNESILTCLWIADWVYQEKYGKTILRPIKKITFQEQPCSSLENV